METEKIIKFLLLGFGTFLVYKLTRANAEKKEVDDVILPPDIELSAQGGPQGKTDYVADGPYKMS